MIVVNVAPRRKHKVAITFSPSPPDKIIGAEYEDGKLLIDKVIAARCNLVAGSGFSLEEVKQLVYVSECYRAKERAIWLLSGQDYSEKSLYDKLLKTFTPKAAAFAVSQMISRGYINDEHFATALVLKCKGKNMSRRAIAEKLAKSGISKEISNTLLNEKEDVSLTDINRATALIKSKYINKISNEDDRRKTFAALMRRGFSYLDIKKAIELSLCDNCFDEEIY